jgi:hypothetical protein
MIPESPALADRQDGATWLQKSRLWSSTASQTVTAPPLQLLPSVPLLANPAWAWAPSFAAAAALLVPPSTQEGGKPSAADRDAAKQVARGAGCVGRALWAAGRLDMFFALATPYPHLIGLNHSQQQLLPIVKRIIAQQEEQQQQQAGRADDAGHSMAAGGRRVDALFREIAADQRAGGLRFLGWLLSHLFRRAHARASSASLRRALCRCRALLRAAVHQRKRHAPLCCPLFPFTTKTCRWLFNSELFVDVAALERLRALRLGAHSQQHQHHHNQKQQQQGGDAARAAPRPAPSVTTAALVFVPAHKSHLDYLLLSYVLFAAGLPCPHIAAGANLSLPVVGRLLRACGAFFIRRTSRGAPDAADYKAVLAGGSVWGRAWGGVGGGLRGKGRRATGRA